LKRNKVVCKKCLEKNQEIRFIDNWKIATCYNCGYEVDDFIVFLNKIKTSEN